METFRKLIVISAITIFLGPFSAFGCHMAEKRVFGLGPQNKVVQSIASCLSDRASKAFRWEAIVKFALEDTKWYEETNSKYCGHGRDTFQCWQAQLDFLIDKSSRYNSQVKSCIREYESRGTYSPHIDYDNSGLQAARAGRWKRGLSTDDLIYLSQQGELEGRYVEPKRSSTPAQQYSPLYPTNSLFSGTNTPASTNTKAKYVPATSPQAAPNSTPKRESVTYHVETQDIPSRRSQSPPPYTYRTYHSQPLPTNEFRTTQNPKLNWMHEPSTGNSNPLPNWFRPQSPTYRPYYSDPPTTYSFPTRFYEQYPQWPASPHPYSSWPNNSPTQRPYISHHPIRPNTFSYSPNPPQSNTNEIDYSQVPEGDQKWIWLIQMATGQFPIATPPPVSTTTSTTQSVRDKIIEMLMSHYNANPVQGNTNNGNTANPLAVAPVITGTMCDREMMSRFTDCVQRELGGASSPRSSHHFVDSQSHSTDDIVSIFFFFKDNYSRCRTSGDRWTSDGKITRFCTNSVYARSGPMTCLPTIMLNLVKNQSKLRNMLLSCVS